MSVVSITYNIYKHGGPLAGDRKRIKFTNIGTDWTEKECTNMPSKLIITWIRARITSGSGSTVAIQIREKSGDSSEDGVALEYPLDADLDYLERSLVYCHKVKDSDPAKLYVAVKVDSGSNSSVTVTLEYE